MKARAAIVSELLELGLIDRERISFENTTFSIPKTGVWWKVNHLPVSSSSVSLGICGEDEDRGIVQVSIHAPKGEGESEAFRVLELLRDHFVAGRSLSYDGQCVTIQQTYAASSFSADNYYITPISIAYYSRRNRPDISHT